MKWLMRIREKIGRSFREKRFRLFKQEFDPQHGDVILDIGSGIGAFLERFATRGLGVIALDISEQWLANLRRLYPDILIVRGDATQLPFKTGSVTIAVSSSVIEHVGDIEAMKHMASEIGRVAKRYFVQTPNKYFPIEPHYMLPFVQFVPRRIKRQIRKRFLRDDFNLDVTQYEPKLLGPGQLRKMFPGSRIVREKFLFLTKSLIAIR